MKRSIGQITGIISLALMILSCNLTSTLVPAPTATLSFTSTPENTATKALPPTFVAPPIVYTDTSVPPTNTSVPSATSTQVVPTETSTNTLIPYDPNATPTPPPTIPSGYHSATPKPFYSKTPTGPAPTARSSGSVTAIQFTPSMDGDWSDWPNAETPASYVVFGSTNWGNSNDLNSSFRAAYDGNYLYIAAKVIDDVYSQNNTGNNLYLGDSLEILMDTNLAGDYYTKGINTDDYQLGISAGKGSIDGPKEAYLWYPKEKKGTVQQVSIASRAISGGYEVEVAIPWSIFGISPTAGQHFGFAFSVSDNDNLNKNVQESMVSNVSTRKFLNPTTWGDLTLQ